MSRLDAIVSLSLRAFADEVLDGSWSGRREREAVSLFVFGFLLREVTGNGYLRDATQIGIECPVPQLESKAANTVSGRASSKEQVCKDVVIWPEPRMTCWDAAGNPTVPPAAVLEWKFGLPKIHEPDVEWLRAYSLEHPGFVGYAVSANQSGGPFRLNCTRVEVGEAQREWLLVP